MAFGRLVQVKQHTDWFVFSLLPPGGDDVGAVELGLEVLTFDLQFQPSAVLSVQLQVLGNV